MHQTRLDEVDRRVLNRLQAGLPLEDRPFAVLGEELGIGEDELIERLSRLKETGVLRRLGAIIDSRQLGFASTLAAMRVPAEDLEQAAALINSYEEVTHNYLRDNSWNVWFTLIAHNEKQIESILREISSAGGWPIMNLPATRVFKIRAEFAL
ncbi:MAG: AsnC family transcriptional regulator [Syntrophomonadaceae bacterium]|nr:AsnC family transcriptional regulator [Syntrophomonadaceae bacterium]